MHIMVDLLRVMIENWIANCSKQVHMFLFGAPTSWSYKPITLQENKLAFGWMQRRTVHFHYCKFWTGIAPYCPNDIFMPSLSNYNTRSQMELDIPLYRTNKGQKSMSFLVASILIMLSSNIKAAATTASFTHSLKKEILEKLQCNSGKFYFCSVYFFSSEEP